VHADATAARSPERIGKRRHFIAQPPGVNGKRQADAAADDRILVENRSIGQIVHDAYCAASPQITKEIVAEFLLHVRASPRRLALSTKSIVCDQPLRPDARPVRPALAQFVPVKWWLEGSRL
jgi:hypothetical protein